MTVVLLGKPSRLNDYLAFELSRAGLLVGVVREHRSRLSTLRRIMKRRGLVRAADVLAFQLYDRLFRTRRFESIAAALLPSQPVVGIPQTDVSSINDARCREFIQSLRPDVLVVHGTGLLKPEVFRLARVCALNLHCGILPEYRGSDSVFWALKNKDYAKVGATVHVIDAGLDTGAIVARCPANCASDVDDIRAWLLAFRAGVAELVRILESGSIITVPGGGGVARLWSYRGLTDHLSYLTSRS